MFKLFKRNKRYVHGVLKRVASGHYKFYSQGTSRSYYYAPLAEDMELPITLDAISRQGWKLHTIHRGAYFFTKKVKL